MKAGRIAVKLLLRYHLQLPQNGSLLLKNTGSLPEPKYALFKRRFSSTLQ